MILDTFKVVYTVVAEMIEKNWSLGHQLPAGLDFAVEYPQGVGGFAALAIRAKFGAYTVEIAGQGLSKRLTTVGTAHGIYVKRDVGYMQLLQKYQEHVDDLGVNHGIIDSKYFYVDLMELAVPSFLGALVAEHGPDGVKFAHSGLQVQSMLNKGSNHRSGSLGPEGKKLPVAVRESVHFLFHNICALSDTASEKLGFFKNGYSYFLVTEVAKDPSRYRFHQLPLADSIG
jgi:hypothetical protein